MTFPLIKDTSLGIKFLIFALLLIFGLTFSGVLGLFFAANIKLAQVISQVVGFMLPPIVYVMLVKEKPFNYLGFNKLPIWSLLGIVAMFTIIPFLSMVSNWNDSIAFPESMSTLETTLRNLQEMNNNISEQMMNSSSLFVGLLIFAVLAAVSEELLFRSVIQKAFIRVFGNAHVGIIVTAIVFSAFHGDFYGFFPRAILGMMLGYMFYLSGSIWPSMLMHFTNNATIVILYFMKRKEIINIDVENFGQTDNILVIVLSLIVTMAIFITCNRFSKRQDLQD